MSVTLVVIFFFQAEDGIRDSPVTGVQTCALPIFANTFRIGCIGYLNSNDMLEALKTVKKTIQEFNIQLN